MQQTLMHLKVLLPFQIFAEKTDVSRIVAETREGSFGLLPHRLDCVAAIVPGILIYENEAEGEVYVAVDEGVLIKTGLDVLVSVRNAIAGTDLGQLREAVDKEFLDLNEREQNVRSVMAKMESGFIRRLVEFGDRTRERPSRIFGQQLYVLGLADVVGHHAERLASARIGHDTHRIGQHPEVAERKIQRAAFDLIVTLGKLSDPPIQRQRECVTHRIVG